MQQIQLAFIMLACPLFLSLLRWSETVFLWNWTANGPTVHPPHDTWVNIEQR
jgi:hypothetical protein